ncbi:hypothetical protein PAHAL_9G509000 [Panicum hallii]|jgi:hypothetical protein|uniref:Uncharacterized protein n=1 Tax=Panicum hallii TaxID=206008 RepID=A0A2T8I5C0_9POAL|nr:hypothetical protein PAHAL_9G509000 [Panicum hallii]
MAPRALQMLTCFSIAVPVPLPAGEEAAHGSAKKRRWSGEFKRKIMASVRRERIRAVREEEEEEEEEACDVDDVEKQRTPQRLRPALKRGRSPRDHGAPEAIAAAVDGIRKRTGLRVRFVLPADQETSAAPVEPPPFPTGVLGEPPESFRHSGPEMTAAFLASVAADAGSAATPVGHELVARWTERKEACSRRLSYLRDYCPFQSEEDEESAPETATTLPAEPDQADNCTFKREEDEESAPETATTLPAEPDHAEALPRVKTGLAFDSPEAEAEFVKAIRARYHLLSAQGPLHIPLCVREEPRDLYLMRRAGRA